MNNNPKFRSRQDAARYVREKYGVRCSPQLLAKLACLGGGPTYRKANGAQALYLDADLDAWAEARISGPRASTSDAGQQAA